jgi:hypothetical protein
MCFRFAPRSRPFVWLAACLAVVPLTSPAACLAAETAVTEDATAPPFIDLVVVGELPESEALTTRILSWFRGLPTLTSVSRLHELEPNAVFRTRERPGVGVWALSRSPALLRLFFAVEGAGDRPRYLVRDVTLESGLDEVGMERVAQVVYLSALALWSGQAESTRREVELGLGAPEPAAVTPPAGDSAAPLQAAEPPRRKRLVVGFEYVGRYAGPAGLSHGPGATLGLALPGARFSWGPRLHAQLLLPHREDAQSVELELRGSSFALGLLAALPAGTRDFVQGEIGAGIDAVRARVVSVPEPSLVANSSVLDFQPYTYVSAGVETDVGFLHVGASALLALSWMRTHYDVAEEDARHEVLVPWLLQPGFGLRATW